MKKIAITFIITGYFLTTQAQIIITNSSFPVTGDSCVIINDYAPTVISAGNAGANQVWNFNPLNNQSQYNKQYLNPSATPNDSSFSSASLAISQSDNNNYAYINLTSSEVDLTGFSGDPGIGYPLNIHFSTPGIISQAGTTYNSSSNYTNSFLLTLTGTDVGQPLADSVRIHYDRYSQNLIDGWGTVITPAGTFQCLRKKVTDSIVTVVDVLIPIVGWQNNFQSSLEIDHFYRYIDNSFTEPVLELEMNNANDTIVRTSYRSSFFTTESIAENVQSSSILVFPNPVFDNMTVESSSAEKKYLRIYNALGEEIMKENFQGLEHSVDLSGLPAGLYMLEIKCAERVLQNKIIKQ